jgi:hypothetical protein
LFLIHGLQVTLFQVLLLALGFQFKQAVLHAGHLLADLLIHDGLLALSRANLVVQPFAVLGKSPILLVKFGHFMLRFLEFFFHKGKVCLELMIVFE